MSPSKICSGDEATSSSNPFKRLASNTDSTWVKAETKEVKSEPEKEKDTEENTTDEEKKEILTGEEEEKNVLQLNAKLFQVIP